MKLNMHVNFLFSLYDGFNWCLRRERGGGEETLCGD